MCVAPIEITRSGGLAAKFFKIDLAGQKSYLSLHSQNEKRCLVLGYKIPVILSEVEGKKFFKEAEKREEIAVVFENYFKNNFAVWKQLPTFALP